MFCCKYQIYFHVKLTGYNIFCHITVDKKIVLQVCTASRSKYIFFIPMNALSNSTVWTRLMSQDFYWPIYILNTFKLFKLFMNDFSNLVFTDQKLPVVSLKIQLLWEAVNRKMLLTLQCFATMFRVIKMMAYNKPNLWHLLWAQIYPRYEHK